MIVTGQPAPFQVGLVDRGDLQLAARAGLDRLRDVHDLPVVEIETPSRRSGCAVGGLLLDAAGASRAVELHHAIALRVLHVVGEHRRSFFAGVGRAQQRLQVVPVEDVVPQDERAGRAAENCSPMRKACARPSGLGCTA
jgi:hypothetical protein